MPIGYWADSTLELQSGVQVCEDADLFNDLFAADQAGAPDDAAETQIH